MQICERCRGQVKRNPYYAMLTDEQIARSGTSWAWKNPAVKPVYKKPYLNKLARRVLESMRINEHEGISKTYRSQRKYKQAQKRASFTAQRYAQPSTDDTRLGCNSAAGSV